MYSLKKIIILAIANLILFSCGNVKQIPIETKTLYNYVDSTIIHRDTISIEIPKEIIKEIVYADSSHLETSVASSTAIVDSCGFLHHSLENKSNTSLKKEIIYKDRIIQRDSLIYKEVPVEVQVEKKIIPKWTYYSLLFNILILILIILKIYIKFTG